jgi:hypothetical protein
MKIITLLPGVDWLALGIFFALWIGYALFANYWGRHERSLIATTNRYRSLWMLQATGRDPRMLDGLITQNLSHTPSFFFIHHDHHHWGLVGIDGHPRQSGRTGAGYPLCHANANVRF